MGGNFLTQMFKPVKSAGNWVKNAAEDTFNFGKNTVSSGVKSIGKVGNRLLNFTDNQFSKVTDIFNNPTLLIVVGAVIVAIVVLK